MSKTFFLTFRFLGQPVSFEVYHKEGTAKAAYNQLVRSASCKWACLEERVVSYRLVKEFRAEAQEEQRVA